MYSFQDFLNVIKTLRSENGCPWDREQTHASLKQYMLEEAYEAVDGIRTYEETGDYTNLQEELGDVLLQVVLHAQIAAEEGYFTIADVINGICEKMVRRHPHVFSTGTAGADTPEQVVELWEKEKKKEKKEETLSDALQHVAKAYPANVRAEKVQKRAAKYGLEFESAQQVFGKVTEELAELREAVNQGNERMDEEFGDLMFSMINLSRFLGLNAENSLTNATNKFINRCVGIELLSHEREKELGQMSAEEIDALWQSIK